MKRNTWVVPEITTMYQIKSDKGAGKKGGGIDKSVTYTAPAPQLPEQQQPILTRRVAYP